MKLYLIPIASVLLQFLATFLALRLIRITERVVSWMIIAGAIFLMAIRRCISLYQWLFDTVPPPPLDISFEIFGLCISTLMAVGLLLISPLFHSIRRSLDLLRQQHRLILDAAGEGIFGLDLEGKVTFVNPAAASLSGYRIEELLGQNIHNMIHYAKADGSPHQVEDCPIHTTLKDGEIHRVAQDVFWTKDGVSFSVEYTATPTTEKNQTIGTTVVFKDITERKKMEERLRQSEEHFRGLITNGTDMVSVLHADGSIQYLSPSVKKMLGYEPEELIGTNAFDLMHSEDVEKIRKLFEEVVQVAESVHVGEYRIRRKDGSWRFHESMGKNLLSHATISGVVLNSRDITDRKQAEEALQELQHRYQTLFHAAADAVFFNDMEGRLLEVNEEACRRLGYTREELLLLTVSDVTTPDYVARRPEILKQLQATGHLVFETELVTRDGQIIPMECSSRLMDFQGETAVLSIARDITERKAAAARLRDNEARFRELFDNMSSAVAVYQAVEEGRDFVLIDHNHALEKIERVKKEDIVGRKVSQVFPGVKDFGLFEVFQRVWRTGAPEHFPPTFYQDQRISGWKENYVYRLPSREVVAIYDDITERKQAEDALRETNETLQAMLQASPVAINLIDTRGNLLIWNRAAEEMFGWRAGEVIGRPLPHLPLGKEEEIRITIDRSLQGVPYIGAEVQRRRKDGSLIDVSLSTAPLRNTQGDVMGVVGILMDISQRKQAEEKISESESRYQQLVELSPDTIFIQTEGKIAYINPAGVKLFGATRPEELLGLSVLDLMHPDHKEIVAERILHLRDETPVPRLEEKYLRLDGSVVDVEVAATPIVYQGKPGALVMARDVAERKRSMREIESLAKFPGENPTPVLRIASNGTILYANSSSSPLLKLWGGEVDQLLPDDLRQLITESLTVNLRKELEVECGGSTYSLVLAPIADLGYLNIYAADISERKRAEGKVRLNEARLQTLLNISQHDAQNIQDLLDYALNAAIQLTSSKVGYIYHYDEESQIFILNTWSKDVMRECSVVDPQTVYQLEKTGIWGEAVRQRQPIMVNDFKALNPLKKGYPEGHVELSRYLTIPVFDGGKIVAVVGVANKDRDYDETDVLQLSLLMNGVWKIFERNRAEEALRMQKEISDKILDNIPVMIAFLDAQGKHQWVNQCWQKILGWSMEEAQNRDILADMYPNPEYRGNVIDSIAKARGSWDDFKTRSRGGVVLDTSWVNIALADGSNIGIGIDITERKSLEGQFLQAQKMEAVGRLAGGVAHDFNNLLSVIFGYGDLMNQILRPQDPLARYLVKIREASDRAAGLTRQLLAFSRKTILAPQILNLNDQLAGIEEMLARLIGEDIKMRMVLEPALGAVQADPGYIEQIIMNLVINARDAMPRGGNLTLKTANIFLEKAYARRHPDLTPGKYVMLAVNDSGQGMDAATQAQVFEPFFTTKELGRGTGLGLSTVYGIVKQSGGHVEVHSKVGQGSTFKIYLPRVQEAVAAVSEAKPIAMDLHGSETVLVVEDEDMLRELICRSLKIYGYTLLAARHGGEALLLCERHTGPIHLLLTDVVMPQMSGRDLADRLTPLRPDMKVLYMSGYPANAIVHHGVVEADVVFIQKPFRTKKLMEKIREILDEAVK